MAEAPRRCYRAPGRVNLIGEHTDYNLGYVLPAALELSCIVSRAPLPSKQLRVFSESRKEAEAWPLASISTLRPRQHWTDYVIGVAQQLVRLGVEVEPSDLVIRSSLPEGAGLSSSAALEVAVALALLGDRRMERIELAYLCQRAEREFVGMPCGIMDQFASLFGQEKAAIWLDCRSLEWEIVRLPEGVELFAVNSMVKHQLAASAYRDRTEECAAAASLLGRPLRDVSTRELRALTARLPDPMGRRARHVVSENDRVVQFVEAARQGNLLRMGRLFVESHRSLQHDFEVSCPELDFLVDAALQIEGVLGARMTGGGFGGCTVNLVRAEAAAWFPQTISQRYEERFNRRPAVYCCRPGAAAGEVHDYS